MSKEERKRKGDFMEKDGLLYSYLRDFLLVGLMTISYCVFHDHVLIMPL
jgi:hypothetical protein